MRRAGCLLGLLIAIAGCETLQKPEVVKNPVVPPPPQRVMNLLTDPPAAEPDNGPAATTDDQTLVAGMTAGQSPDSDIAQMAYKTETAVELPSTTFAEGNEVAALVNGHPIFVDDIIPSAVLDKARAKMPPKVYEEQRMMLIRKNLRPHIERELLVQALKSRVKEDQLKALNKHLDAKVEEEEKSMMKKLKVETSIEFDAKLQEQGLTLTDFRNGMRNQLMAQNYIALKSMPKEDLGRPDLLAYYQENIADYEFPGEVKWQHIVLAHAKHGGAEGARTRAQDILSQLQSGADFGELAKKYSNGPNSKVGGTWDWTKEGSLAAKEVETMLFEIPVGEVGPPIVREHTVEIVRVIERKDAGRQPFREVQAAIRDKLRHEDYRVAAQNLLNELNANAEIHTMFDDETPAPKQSAMAH